ncbi:MAG: hypothetical protein ACI9SK_002722, partial [Zhongshania sp.]
VASSFLNFLTTSTALITCYLHLGEVRVCG